jgi:hypothetical protein
MPPHFPGFGELTDKPIHAGSLVYETVLHRL